MKMSEDHFVPLTQPALDMLDETSKGEQRDLIFTNPDGQEFSENAMLAVLDRLGWATSLCMASERRSQPGQRNARTIPTACTKRLSLISTNTRPPRLTSAARTREATGANARLGWFRARRMSSPCELRSDALSIALSINSRQRRGRVSGNSATLLASKQGCSDACVPLSKHRQSVVASGEAWMRAHRFAWNPDRSLAGKLAALSGPTERPRRKSMLNGSACFQHCLT